MATPTRFFSSLENKLFFVLLNLLLLSLFPLLIAAAFKNEAAQPPPQRGNSYRNNADNCVQFLSVAGSRKCGRGCSAGFTCRNEKRRCLCDGVCGRSCVIANRPCVKPKLDNGKFEIVPYNRFGAEAIYSCNNGFVLSGPSRRICQGDGQWSDEEPRCEKEVMCTAPPLVRHSFHNGFPEDENARYSIGTQIRYTCLPGFQMFGFPKAMCLAGRWMGPRLVCSPRNCGDPGPLADGRQEGSLYYFGHSVVFICDTGFELAGDSFRKCQANGTWSGVQPKCTTIQCPLVHPPAYGSILAQNNSVGGILKTACQPGYLLQGDEERVCQRDRRWSGRRANCTKIECGDIGNLANGRVVYTGSGLGAVAYFRCDPNAVAWPPGAPLRSVCLREGRWSDPPPKCLANCRITFSSEGGMLVNGTRPSPYHYTISGQIVQLVCNQTGYRLYPGIPLLRCLNGTWQDGAVASINSNEAPLLTLPTCQPLSCTDPPPSIENGLIRWRPSTHGERAFYVCIPGYVLSGNDSATCLYGQWQPTGPAMPQCRESFCSYPGPLQNGDIIILGRFGLYEFTPEINKLRHGEQIEFGCKTDYRLIGQRKATCVNGRWSPAFKPLCIQKNCEAILSAEYRRVEAVSSFSKVTGEKLLLSQGDQPNANQASSIQVALGPSAAEQEESSSPQASVPGSETIRINCPPGYRSIPPDGLATCVAGKWYPTVPSCIDIRLASSEDENNNNNDDKETEIQASSTSNENNNNNNITTDAGDSDTSDNAGYIVLPKKRSSAGALRQRSNDNQFVVVTSSSPYYYYNNNNNNNDKNNNNNYHQKRNFSYNNRIRH